MARKVLVCRVAGDPATRTMTALWKRLSPKLNVAVA